MFKVIVQLAVPGEILRSRSKFVSVKSGEVFGVGRSPYSAEVRWHVL